MIHPDSRTLAWIAIGRCYYHRAIAHEVQQVQEKQYRGFLLLERNTETSFTF